MKRALYALALLLLALAFFGIGNGRADFKINLPSYSEGTWTPVLFGVTTAGTFTYSTQTGRFAQIGNTVCANGGVVVTAVSVTAGGNMRVSGLPFAAANIGASISPMAMGQVGNIVLPSGYSQFTGVVVTGTSQIALQTSGNNITNRSVVAGDIQTNSQIFFGGCYYIGS